MACSHVNDIDLAPPHPKKAVYREDCTQCFDSIDDPAGLDVCLYCFNGGCAGDRNHARLHVEHTGHPLALNIRRTRKPVSRDEPPQKMSKLSIAAETESDRYETVTSVKCYKCEVADVDQNAGRLGPVIAAVLKANTFAQQEEVKAWQLELTSCEHILMLQQAESRAIDSGALGHCSQCDLKENLWLCLSCGNLGCGRQQYGGLGGNSHALSHFESSGHGVAVKLGSLTADGEADIYCYACNEERVDEDLKAHLAHWGVDIAERQKTEKNLTEMQIEQNLRWEFSMTTEDGKELLPLFGAGFTGLKNLGNSCYLNSIVQSIFSFPQFQERYYHPDEAPPHVSAPAEDLETQLRKLADGVLSGRYAKPDSDVTASEYSPEIPHQKGLAPAMFKYLVGRGHEEFATMRQQDASEFLLHILKLITRSAHPAPLHDPVASFRFAMEQRLQCTSCKKVRYRTEEQESMTLPVPIRKKPASFMEDKDEYQPVTLKECLDIFTADEVVELTCPACGSKDGFHKRTLFKTFPEILVITARRFELVNWVPNKRDVPVLVDDEPIALDAYKSHGLLPDEEELPEDAVAPAPAFTPHVGALGMLMDMGFPQVRAEKALHATGNSDVEAASEWLFAHMEDPDIDAPMDFGGGPKGKSDAVCEVQLQALVDMGFSQPVARQALRETDGELDRAVEWVFSHPDATGEVEETGQAGDEVKEKALPGNAGLPAEFQLQSIVCHKGASIHAGHYVSFIRKQLPGVEQPSWVLFNDEKVAKAADVDEMKKFAYIYFFRHL